MADLTDRVSQQPIAILHRAIMQIDGVMRAILVPLLTDEDTVIVQGMQLERDAPIGWGSLRYDE